MWSCPQDREKTPPCRISSQLFISLDSTNVFLRDRTAVANKQPYESHAENVNHMKLEDDSGDEEKEKAGLCRVTCALEKPSEGGAH